MATVDEILAQLTGPGGPFEVVTEDVLGERMAVIAGRTRSLRALLEASRAHADKEYIVHGERRITFAEHADRVASVARALSERYGFRRAANQSVSQATERPRRDEGRFVGQGPRWINLDSRPTGALRGCHHDRQRARKESD